MKKIAFVIITWNSEKYIKDCLNAILNLKKIEYKIFVVDNGSKDKTTDILLKMKNENIDIELLEKNYGTTISRNIGLKKIDNSFDYVCVLDSDTIINEDAFSFLIKKLELDSKIGIIGPELKDSNGKKQNSGRNLPMPKEKILKIIPFEFVQKKAVKMEKVVSDKKLYQVGYLMSACWLMPLRVIKEIGLLDEKIFYAPEDAEYCARNWVNGYKIIYTNEVSIIHEWQRISRKKIISKINFEHIKGLIYFWKKYGLNQLKEINKKIYKE